MKTTYSRKRISDKFTSMTKADGTPMSRQQIHMLRKKARGICLTCGESAVGVYCLKHTIVARERMRLRLKNQRRAQKVRGGAVKSPARAASAAKAKNGGQRKGKK
jgi:hypothetical protein